MAQMEGLSYTNTVDTLTANAFARTGYDFAGWALKADGTGTATFADQDTVGGEKFGVTADGQTINLYAQWKARTYKVGYNKTNGGTAGASRPASATYDTPFSVSAPTRTGYTFTGWTVSGYDAETACSGSSATACNEKIGDDGKISATGDIYLKNLTPQADKTVTLTAQWTPLTCRVTFSKEGGSDGTSEKDISYGQMAEGLATIEPPTRGNYTFLGYYTTASGEGVCYFEFSYHLLATDSLTPPVVWHDFGATNVGTGVAQAFEIPIETSKPQRFFKIETIQTPGD